MTDHNKLVRNLIPGICEAEGLTVRVRALDDDTDFEDALNKKLSEEHIEFIESRSLEELADMFEVFLALGQLAGFSIEEIDEARQAKATARGDFSGRIFLESVEE